MGHPSTHWCHLNKVSAYTQKKAYGMNRALRVGGMGKFDPSCPSHEPARSDNWPSCPFSQKDEVSNIQALISVYQIAI